MIHAGIKPDNIGISDICTSCNSDWLFSHRASHGKRGVLCGFMSICR
ncbi:MAG: laccase domain-containing protein [Lachnospira eligens]|jgi:copper oxidase (laccase) domain-containing protein